MKSVKMLSGTPSEREESSHAVGREVGRLLSEATLNELADELQHPCRCGYQQVEERIFAADGGEWCWSIHHEYFAAAHGILDWSHVREHVWDAARALHPDDEPARKAWAAA